MTGSTTQCLIFAGARAEPAEHVASLLCHPDVSVTVATTDRECLDLLDRHDWRLLVIDAGNGSRGALRLLSHCRQMYPDLTTLVLVRRGDIATTVQTMKAGATDCIEIPIDTTRLLTVIAALCQGQDRNHCDAYDVLTRTERLVLHHILEGQTSQEIAEQLCRSRRTIEVHRRNIMKKMNAESLVDLVKPMMRRNDPLP